MHFLEWREVTKRYGGAAALTGVSLVLRAGEVLGIIGPSGSGKSTLLRLTAGLEKPDTGTIMREGRDIGAIPPHRRGFGLMFQDYGLFPHLSVARNIGFGLRMMRWTRERERARVGEMLALVRMPGFAGREVHTLSGGEQQRVALARSLAPEPRMLMLDEPLGALDAALRMDLLGEISGILRGIGMTAVYVTHDQEEAMTIADRVALLDRGRIMQVGSPDELISRPACAFVCSFLKLGTVVPARRTRQGGGWLVRTDLGDFLLRDGISGKPLLLVRPEAVLFARRPGAVKVNARILSRTPLPDGASIRMALLGRSGRGHPLDLHTGSAGKIPPGSTVRNVWIDPRSCLLVAADA